jgi:hypothetical protein
MFLLQKRFLPETVTFLMDKRAILLGMRQQAVTKPISQQSTQILSTMHAGKIWHVVNKIFYLLQMLKFHSNTVKLGYNELGYNELPLIANR